ncbi:CHAT domain-containing protein [Nostoc sp. CMAA1605]|uniref:CHAT domain-containing protein n=1 Tax=Nostoc sp. CMAA1605 TaxID=2055159 RepID=UPI001F3D6EFB|nr:tetratricopeptide repeat protein [Nostoc sp. CMAA1605]
MLWPVFHVSVAESKINTLTTAQTQTTQERRDEVLRLNQLGLQQLNQGQFQDSLKSFEQALAIAKQINDTAGIARTFNNMGGVYVNQGEYTKALNSFQRALAIAKQINDKAGIARILNSIGFVYSYMAEYTKALDLFRQALVIRQEIDDTAGVGITLSNIGHIYSYMGEYAKALDFYQQALAIQKQINSTAGVGTTLNNIAAIYESQGEYAKALDFYQQALAIQKKINSTAGIATNLNNIGSTYRNLGQYDKALDFYQQALAIFTQIRNPTSQAVILNNIGVIYNTQGKYAKALDFHQQALAIQKQISDKAGIGTTLNNIGNVYRNKGEYTKALEHYQQSLAIVKTIDDKANIGGSLNNIGTIYDHQGDYTKALDFYQQALAILKQVGNTEGVGTTLSNIAASYNSLGNYADAEKTLFAAIEVFESLRTKELSDDQKISIFEKQASNYRFLQQVLINQNKINTALEIAERGRARALVELLSLNISLNNNNNQTIKPPNIEQIRQIAKAQNATLVEYSIIDEPLRVNSKQEPQISKLYIWVIKANGEIAFKQVDLKSLKTPLTTLVNKSRLAIGAGGRGIKVNPKNGANKKQYLQQLHEVLITPIASLLPNKPQEKVIFIPHDSLFLVPFAALQDKNDQYLITKHTIVTAPAIQVLDLTRQQRQKITGKEMLVIGNPIMPKVGIPPVQLDPLQGAEKEVLTIANLFKTKAITGKDATKAALKQKLSTAKIIHLATHGLLDDPRQRIPTAIALAPTSNDDGLLTPAEILNLKINAELVVLSACDTGRGTITGDGVIGLSRAFITAGAPSVIVSLWAVPDSPTSELMTEFYRQWEKNSDKAVALRNAMLITMNKYPNPRDWAAFTLIGESETVQN